MNSKTISVLAAAALSIGFGFAATSSASAALAMGEMPAPAYADTDLLIHNGRAHGGQVIGGGFVPPQQARKAEAWSRRLAKRPPKVQLAPKTCYERKRVGPKQYVLVRRAC